MVGADSGWNLTGDAREKEKVLKNHIKTSRRRGYQRQKGLQQVSSVEPIVSGKSIERVLYLTIKLIRKIKRYLIIN